MYVTKIMVDEESPFVKNGIVSLLFTSGLFPMGIGTI